MCWEEIEQLARTGIVDFGSHTHAHPILSTCSVLRQHEELARSQRLLRERLGQADLFAYPNGRRCDFTVQTTTILRELGYRCGLTTIPGLNRHGVDLFQLRRVNLGSDVTLKKFERFLVGC
jgi:peptidoglycan/xylan/chitin deacetylase (PgdA/CDA1 family)